MSQHEKDLLACALVKAGQESPQFYNHVINLLKDVIHDDTVRKGYIAHLADSPAHAKLVADKRAELELQDNSPRIPLPLSLDQIYQPDPFLTNVVISEVIHRGLWDKVLEDTQVITGVIVDHIGKIKPAGPA